MAAGAPVTRQVFSRVEPVKTYTMYWVMVVAPAPNSPGFNAVQVAARVVLPAVAVRLPGTLGFTDGACGWNHCEASEVAPVPVLFTARTRA